MYYYTNAITVSIDRLRLGVLYSNVDLLIWVCISTRRIFGFITAF